jgi:DHA3 family macrolide efflux protein-like MFS transporter
MSLTKLEELANKETLKSYMYFFAGQLFSLFGSQIIFFVIFVWITVETESPLMLSLANFIFLIPTLVFFPIAGVISDRYDRKKIILVADSLLAFLTTIMALLFIFDFTIIWIILLIIGLRSVCQAFHMPTVSAIIPSMIPKEKLSRINSIRFMFLGVVNLIGPAVGATLLTFFPIKYILWIDVITFFIALYPLLTLKAPKIHIDKDSREMNSFIREIKDGYSIVKKIPGLLIIMLLAMLLYLLSQPAMTLAPFFVIIIHGGNEFIYALNAILFQGGMILGSFVISFKKVWKNKMRLIFIGIMIINIGYLIYAMAPIGIFLYMQIGLVIMGLFMPLVSIIIMTIIQITVPLDKMGRVSSILNTFTNIASPIGAILAGPLSIILGVSNLYILCAIFSIIVTLIPYMFSRFRRIDYDQPILDSMK